MCAYAGRVVAAVDLGGTKIQTLLFDENRVSPTVHH